MKKWKQLVLGLALVLGIGAVAVPAPSAGAINIVKQSCNVKSNADDAICKAKGDNAFKIIKTAINAVLMVLGIVAVIMIIIGAFRYVTSAGEAKHIEAAKNTIMYAIIGLVIAILSFAIVNFVVNQF